MPALALVRHPFVIDASRFACRLGGAVQAMKSFSSSEISHTNKVFLSFPLALLSQVFSSIWALLWTPSFIICYPSASGWLSSVWFLLAASTGPLNIPRARLPPSRTSSWLTTTISWILLKTQVSLAHIGHLSAVLSSPLDCDCCDSGEKLKQITLRKKNKRHPPKQLILARTDHRGVLLNEWTRRL